MKKLALFVEGLTEQIFAQRLIEAIAGRLQIQVELVKALGGANGPRRFTRLQATSPIGASYYILICDCSGETSVLSDIRNQHPTLTQQGFTKVLGLRDVYPGSHADAPRMMAAMLPHLPKEGIPARVLLAITEIEAWFLAEETHYKRIHPELTPSVAASLLGQLPSQLQVETIPHPADSLDQIYRTVGLRYTKDRRRIARAVQALDCAELYLKVAERVAALGHLCNEIDQFLSPSAPPSESDPSPNH